MQDYKARILDQVIDNRLRNKGAILVEGAKWCGKTTTCEQHAKSILYMSDPDRASQNMQMADISPRALLKGDSPRLIDEWQIAPKLWDAIRFEVDQLRRVHQLHHLQINRIRKNYGQKHKQHFFSRIYCFL